MGIINTTPDSFSDGGVHLDADVAVKSGLQMLRDGADILDVGGESTRPGSLPVSEDEETRRAIPVIRGIIEADPSAVLSIDTRRRPIAEAAIKAGATIINDIAGFRDDPSMIDLARETGAAVVVMHMLGQPKNMQKDINYISFPGDIYDFFVERIRTLEDAGIAPEKIVIDPGIGFGKTFDQNLILINRMEIFKDLGKHVLMAPSRKGFLGKILNEPEASRRDTGTLAAVVASVLKGAAIVRVHEVANTVQACRVADAIVKENAGN
jgi:dihydropteroate synthase